MPTSKKEISQIMEGGAAEELYALSQHVSNTLNEFQDQANRGLLTRDYVDARGVIKICAGYGGVIHGKEYWQDNG